MVLASTAQEQLIGEESFIRRQESIRVIPEDAEKRKAVEWAREAGIPTRVVFPDGRIIEIRRLGPGGQPEYFTTLNRNAAGTLSTDRVWKNGGEGLELTGEGVVVGVWDGGVFRVSHREFGQRGRIMNPIAELSGHATHVTGTIGAAGIDENATGMAGKVVLEGYDWDNDLQEMDAAAREGLLLSNHSYGYILGFNYNEEEERWEWWGDTDKSELEDYLFGYYDSEAQMYDRIAYDNPRYLIVKSAGNDRGEGPASGAEHFIWQNGEWVASTVERPRDGESAGFDCMGPVSSAKNLLSVGAVRDLPNGYANPESVKITGFSVFGPTDDGRIKPDLVGNGESLFSTYSESDDDYRNISGTSMSAPNVTGSLALLQEQYAGIYGEYLRSASLKGIVLHTADDAGNAGPDYRFGWGLMNTLSAARIIGNTDYRQIQEEELVEGDTFRIRLYSEGTGPVKATLCWTDPPGNVPPAILDPTLRILINDLDIRIIREIDGHEFRPFVLDPLQPDKPAATGDNITDNIEQVVIGQAEKGFYEVVVLHKGTLSQGSQHFSLVVSGLASEFFATGQTSLTDNNGSFILTSASEYLPGMDASWLITPVNGNPVSLSFNFFETDPNTDSLRVHDGADGSAPLLAALSGNLSGTDTVIHSSQGALWVSFTSDSQEQGRGFEAFYCSTPPEGSFSIGGETAPCLGAAETYVASGQEGTSYSWSTPPGWNVVETGENWAILETGPQSSMIGALPYNQCGEATVANLDIEPINTVPVLLGFTGDSVLCAGETGFLSVDSLPGAFYEWVLPKNWLGSSETHSISFVPSLDQGEVRVSARNACGPGDTLSVPILLNTIPDAAEILSVSEKICQNSMNSFYVHPSKGADYLWSVQPDWFINGADEGDTVEIRVGMNSSYLFVKASNECGFRNSNRFFLTSPQPETPLLMETESTYETYREIEVANATAYQQIRWYIDSILIDSPHATGASYVAFLPGTYSVGVTNREDCSLVQDPQDGITIADPNQHYAVHAGEGGSLVIYNTTTQEALLNVYDLGGNLLLCKTVPPGNSIVPTTLRGIFIVSLSGLGEPRVSRVFMQ
jgi:hypothetical protein